MPYIRTDLRRKAREEGALNPGELNYLITSTVLNYLFEVGESYRTYNDILGVLEAVKFEIYRRKIANYEDIKCKENGDIFS